ncbi:MAG: hypothetical protein F4Y58_02810, partial [Gammaproteobacteria bacterium]|nr:hypothetical protein [Gammaproteobacteria bacterium]
LEDFANSKLRYGGLVGSNDSGNDAGRAMIINSYATGEVSAYYQIDGIDYIHPLYDVAGGLVGGNGFGDIVNSYASGDVSGDDAIGGLVGNSREGDVINSYAIGNVSGDEAIGGLVGENRRKITDSYAIGEVNGSIRVGGLIGLNGDASSAVIHHSYWNAETSGQLTSAAGSSRTTVEMQQPPAPGTTGQTYEGWNAADWYFGTASDYPILKYAQNPNILGPRSCDAEGLPDCGDVISPDLVPPEHRLILTALTLVDGTTPNPTSAAEVVLVPPFGSSGRELADGYTGTVIGDKGSVRLKPTINRPATVKIYLGNNQTPHDTIVGGGISAPIALGFGINLIILEISAADGYKLRYRLSLNKPIPIVVNYLEDLDAIRNDPNGNYVLARDLDFADDAHYRDIANKVLWTVDDDSDAGDSGWQPIASAAEPFSGTFDGNGYTIRNLQINRKDSSAYLGLFAAVGRYAEVTDVALLNARVTVSAENTHIGILAGMNEGIVVGSRASGELLGGKQYIGGLVGLNKNSVINSYTKVKIAENPNDASSSSKENYGGLVGGNDSGNNADRALIINSYAMGEVSVNLRSSGNTRGGGLVGINGSGNIVNSYAIGNVSGRQHIGGLAGENRGDIRNSYATGTVTIIGSKGGGLVGQSGFGFSHVSNIINSYAIGFINGNFGSSSQLGGLVGATGGDSNDSFNYWNSEINRLLRSSYGNPRTTAELQQPTAPGTAGQTYTNWSTADWDFGTASEYPILKYAQNPNVLGRRSCDAEGLPNCGDVISPELRPNLIALTLVDGTTADPTSATEIGLVPPFGSSGRELSDGYIGTIQSTATVVRLKPTISRPGTIKIYLVNNPSPHDTIASGGISAPIALNSSVSLIILDISAADGEATVRYRLYLNKPTLVVVNYLEDLDAIRNNPYGDYILARDLDFADDAHYRDIA